MVVGRPTETRWVTWIDAARVAAILAVISIHVVTSLVTARSNPDAWWFGNVVSSASRWCVPLFVMLSGTLLLQPGREERLRSFYQRRFARIGLPLVVWTLVYLWVGHLRTDHPADLGEAVSLTLAGLPYYHMYFVYLIAGVYLVTPFFRPLAAARDSRLLAAGAALFLAIGMLDLAIRVWGGHGGVNAVTRFVPYIGYFLAGAWLSRVASSRRRVLAAACIAVVGIALTAVGTDQLVGAVGLGRGRYLYEYLSVTTVPVSLAIFALFAWSAPLFDRVGPKPRRWLSTLAAATFGIYLVHPLVLIPLRAAGLYNRAFFVPLAVVATVVAAFVVSAVLALIAQRLPVLRRLI